MNYDNVNLGTCGAQATAPIMHAISRVTGVEYGEIVATIAQQERGARNAAEHRRVHADHGAHTGRGRRRERGKAIIVMNPADPPIMMKDTVFAAVPSSIDREAVLASIDEAVADVQAYVPGYHLKTEPVFDEGRVTVFVEVEGAGALSAEVRRQPRHRDGGSGARRARSSRSASSRSEKQERQRNASR